MPSVKNKTGTSYRTDRERWQAVLQRDKNVNDAFFYSVKTTGVYCRPWCPARRARRENVAFHLTPKDAERAGFRPCKRCKPNDPSAHGEPAAMVAQACKLIVDAEEPLSLDALAEAVGMSRWHFHRVFKSLTGLTPKAYATAHRAKRMHEELSRRGTVTSAIYNSGFNSNGRFYAESNKRLGMKPTEFKAGGDGATIAIGDDPHALVRELQDRFPKADLIGGDQQFERMVARVVAFVENPSMGLELPLDVQGTSFQQRVWKALSEIPCGETRTYSELAEKLGRPNATRAVAGACGANNLALAIPCHRVVRTNGSLSGYRWGVERKEKLLQAEGARI